MWKVSGWARVVAFLLVTAGLLGSATVGAQSYPPAVTRLIADARAHVKTIDMATFKSALDRGDAGLLIDVREPEEYASGHIPRAINIPRGLIELSIWPHLGYPERFDPNARITLYCASGTRCVLAAQSLQGVGLTNVVAVDMRLADWAKAGYPITR